MGLIKNEFIERIKEEADVVKVVGSFCQDLKKRGANYVCLSPFGKENTPSFTVSPSKGIWKDFSSGKGGNAITFVMEKEGLAFPEAIEWLAKFMSLEVEYESAEWAAKAVEKKKKREALRPLLMATHKKYREALAGLADDHPAKAELAKRGYSQSDIVEWGIGFAPGQKFLYKQIAEIGQTEGAEALGLINGTNDRYWQRVVYPMRDRNGLLIGFAGRDVSGSEKSAKWINPPTSEMYDKDKTWFALDRAAAAINKAAEAWIVEGYNDVIAWHKAGLLNTISPCGTAITERQMQILRKLTAKVVLVMDGDKAGKAATLKHVPALMRLGFRVECVFLPQGEDPDSFTRDPFYKRCFAAHGGLATMLDDKQVREDGFRTLLEHYIGDDEIENARGVGELVKVIAYVNDDFIRESYCGWLAKESGRKEASIKKAVADELKAAKPMPSALAKAFAEADEEYRFPKEVAKEAKDLLPIVKKYGCFQAKNRIYMQVGSEPPYTFKKVSNFSVEIIQHMNDEKFPMKLLRICNVHGKQRIFDTLSDNLNSPMSFTNIVTGHGNFFWEGGRNDHMKLLRLLFDRMGDGEKIDVLGWQKSGFWVTNNQVIFPAKGIKEPDDNGVFTVKDGEREISYYVPSANSVYKQNPYKYMSQKKVVVEGDATLGFTRYVSKMVEVHRGHAITGILFTVASIFQDVVVDQLGNFPMVFLYGPPSTGKDQLIECCQSFFGKPQTAINLEGGVSTAKAQIREFAQFCNMISHLSEYKRGDPKLDGILKGLWDRRGYKRGTIDSHVGSESIPILSSVFLTGNDYPDQDALITRVLWEEMTIKDFSPEQIKAYEELKDMYQSGVSHLLPQILQHREKWEKHFKENFRKVGRSVKEALTLNVDSSRILANITVLATTYEMMKDELQFPFAWDDVMQHFKEMSERQMRKLNTGSIFLKFWDCFLQVAQDPHNNFKFRKHYTVADGMLYFQWTTAFNTIAPQWYKQYSEVAPGKSKIADMLTESKELGLVKKDSFRFDGTSVGNKTSAWCVRLSGTTIEDDLMYMLEPIINNELNDGGEAKTNESAKDGAKDDKDDLPF